MDTNGETSGRRGTAEGGPNLSSAQGSRGIGPGPVGNRSYSVIRVAAAPHPPRGARRRGRPGLRPAIWGLASWDRPVPPRAAWSGSARRRCRWPPWPVTLVLSVTTWRHTAGTRWAERSVDEDAVAGASPDRRLTTPASPCTVARAGRAARPVPTPAPWLLSRCPWGSRSAAVRCTGRRTWKDLPAGLGPDGGSARVPLLWEPGAVRGGGSGGPGRARRRAAESQTPRAPGRRGSWLCMAASASVWRWGAGAGVSVRCTSGWDADRCLLRQQGGYVAETGRIPLRDTIYSDQALPALRGAEPRRCQSIEALEGAVAHLLGISAGTVVYLVARAA